MTKPASRALPASASVEQHNMECVGNTGLQGEVHSSSLHVA